MSHPEEKEVSFFDERQETNRTNDTFDDGASAIDGDVVLVRRNSGKGAKQYKMSDVSHYHDNNNSRHVPTRTEDMGAHLWESQSSMPFHLADKSTVYSEAYGVYSPPQSIKEDHTIDQYDDDDAQTYQTYGTQSDEEEQSYVSQTGDGVDAIPNQDDLYDDNYNNNNNNEPTNQSGQLSLEAAESVIIHHDVENSVSTTIQHDVSKKSSKRSKKSSKSSKKKHKRHKSEKSGKDIGHSRKHTRKQSLSNTQNESLINSTAATATTTHSGGHNTKSIHPSESAAATLLSKFKQQHNQHNQQYQGSGQHVQGTNNNSNGSNNLNVNDSEPDLASTGTVTASSLLTILEPSSRPVIRPQQQMPVTPTHDPNTGTLDEAALQEVYFSAMIEKQQEISHNNNPNGRGSLGLPRQISSKNYTSDAPETRKRSSTTKHINNHHNHDRGYDTSALSGILHTSRSDDIYDNHHTKFPVISNFKSNDQSPNTIGGVVGGNDNSIMRPQINRDRDDHYSGSDEGGESDLDDNPNRPRQGRRLSALTRENLMTHTNNQHQHDNGIYHSDIEYVRQKTRERTQNGQNFGTYNEDFGGIMSSVEFNDRRFGNNNDGYATHAGHGNHNNHHNNHNNYGLPPKGGSFRRPRKHKNNVTAPMRANIVTPAAVSVASTIPATMATNTQTPGRNNYPRTINVTGGNTVTFANNGAASVTGMTIGPTPHSAMSMNMGIGGGGQIDSFSNYGTVISTNSNASSDERRHQRGLLQRKYDKQSNEDNRSRSPGLASVSEDNEQSPYPYNPIQQQRQMQNIPMQNMNNMGNNMGNMQMQQMGNNMGQQQGMPYMDLSAQNTQRTMYSSHQTQDSSHSYHHRQEIRYRDDTDNNSKLKKYLAIGAVVAAVVVVGWYVLPKLFGSKSKSGYSGRYGSAPRIRRAPRRY